MRHWPRPRPSIAAILFGMLAFLCLPALVAFAQAAGLQGSLTAQ